MVATIIQVLGSESSVTSSGSDFSGNQLIRVYNNNASDVVISLLAADSSTVGTFTLHSYETAYVRKSPTQKVAAATACKMTPVAF